MRRWNFFDRFDRLRERLQSAPPFPITDAPANIRIRPASRLLHACL
ncbi:MAG: hypothetical protein LBB72_09035 [Spirochaetaceae bacterium]|nr:hypothetical protein [Spirochaetaceae bacterium]